MSTLLNINMDYLTYNDDNSYMQYQSVPIILLDHYSQLIAICVNLNVLLITYHSKQILMCKHSDLQNYNNNFKRDRWLKSLPKSTLTDKPGTNSCPTPGFLDYLDQYDKIIQHPLNNHNDMWNIITIQKYVWNCCNRISDNE
jgi:hypothetical protein